MSASSDFNIVADYFRSILIDVERLEIFANAVDFDSCTRDDVGGKLMAIRKTHRASLLSIAARDENFHLAVGRYMKDLSAEEISLMESPEGYDWRTAKADSWPDLTTRKLCRFEMYL